MLYNQDMKIIEGIPHYRPKELNKSPKLALSPCAHTIYDMCNDGRMPCIKIKNEKYTHFFISEEHIKQSNEMIKNGTAPAAQYYRLRKKCAA